MSLIESLSQRHRRWELAANSRTGVWARTRARAAQRDYARRNWRCLFVFSSTGVLLTAGVSEVMPTVFLVGLTMGAGLTAMAASISIWVLQVTGTAAKIMGATAEQWTASELRRMRPHGWQLVNHFTLSQGDIDHVLIGPGGAFAVETKWSATPWTLDSSEGPLHAAARQVETGARRLSLWHGFRQARVTPVQPVVMLWGAGSNELPALSRIGGTLVVPGPSARSWLTSLSSHALTPHQVESAWASMDAHLRKRDPLDQESDPLPPSLLKLLAGLLVPVTSSLLGLLTASALVAAMGWNYWFVVVLLVIAVAVAPALKQKRIRLLAIGWQAGLLFSLVTYCVVALTVK